MIWRCFKLDGKQEKKMFWTHFEFDVSNTGKGQKNKQTKKKDWKSCVMLYQEKKKRSGGTFSQLIRLLSNMICYTKKNILEKLSLTEVKPTRISPFAKDRDWVGKRFFKTTVNLI